MYTEDVTVLQVDDQVCGTVWQGGLPTCHEFNATEFIVCVDPRINLNERRSEDYPPERTTDGKPVHVDPRAFYLLA